MNRAILTGSVIVGIVAMMMLSVLPAMAEQRGNIKELYPPGNDGLSHGIGMIDGDDGKNYIFRTPDDNNGAIISVGDHLTFEVAHGKYVTNVQVLIEGQPCEPGTICSEN